MNLSQQEKKAVMNIITSILIMAGYTYYSFVMKADENLSRVDDLQFWGKFTLILMGVTIAFKILSHIIFIVIVKEIRKGEDPDFLDDYDKQIEMRSDRNSQFVFALSFVSAMIPIAMCEPLYVMFTIMLTGGFISGILGDLWKIYYYRTGL